MSLPAGIMDELVLGTSGFFICYYDLVNEGCSG